MRRVTNYSSPGHLEPAFAPGPTDWGDAGYDALKAAGICQVSHVPDKGHARLIQLLEDDPSVDAIVLTTEEEGIAIAAGSWLGGKRSALLMQSSGVGNCINMLSLGVMGRFPILMLVTMRGEWAEFNPWQMPMSMATETVLKAMGVQIVRISAHADVQPMIESAARMAFDADQMVAVLISQRLLQTKVWDSE